MIYKNFHLLQFMVQQIYPRLRTIGLYPREAIVIRFHPDWCKSLHVLAGNLHFCELRFMFVGVA